MPEQLLRVYRKTGSLCPAYRSNADPKGCLVTVGAPEQPAALAVARGAAEAWPRPSEAAKPTVRMAAAPIRVAQLILVHDLRYLIEPPACRGVPVAVHRNSLAKLFTLTTDKSP